MQSLPPPLVTMSCFVEDFFHRVMLCMVAMHCAFADHRIRYCRYAILSTVFVHVQSVVSRGCRGQIDNRDSSFTGLFESSLK